MIMINGEPVVVVVVSWYPTRGCWTLQLDGTSALVESNVTDPSPDLLRLAGAAARSVAQDAPGQTIVVDVVVEGRTRLLYRDPERFDWIPAGAWQRPSFAWTTTGGAA